MHRLLANALALVAFFVSCVDVPHDNIYDPENPDRAYLSAITYEFGVYPIEGATVCLVQAGNIVKSDTSDAQGVVEFEDVVPGIYGISAEAPHFASVECYPESLWAGRYVPNQRIGFLTLDFEDDALGSSSPYSIEDVQGTWTIILDHQQPDSHSTPNVYNGTDSSANAFALSMCGPEAQHFLLEGKMKIDGSSGANWQAGVVFRYQDENNYYGFIISPETVYCYQVVNGQNAYTGSMARESAADVWHTLRVERLGIVEIIRMSLNDLVLLSLYDNNLSGGRVGLFVSNNDNPAIATANFDDITLDPMYTHNR